MLLLALALAVQTPPAPAGVSPASDPNAAAFDPNAASASDPNAAATSSVAGPAGAPPVRGAPPSPYQPVLLGPPPPGPQPLFTPVPLDLRPPPPVGNGTGLIIGAAIAGGVNIGLAAARFGLLLGDPTDRREAARFYLTAIAMPIDVAAGVGLAAGAGYLRGRWDGYRSAYNGEPRVRAAAFTQSGAVLLVIGAVGYVMAFIPWDRDASIAARGGGTLLAEAASSLVLMAGTGLIAYGMTWRKHADKHGYYRRLGLRPSLSPNNVGLSFVGRF